MSKEENQIQIIQVAKDLLEKAGFQANVRITESGFGYGALPVVLIESDNDLSVLIGKNGQNLNALEHLIRVLASRKIIVADDDPERGAFLVDINDYRKSRSHYILEIARSAATRVINTQKAEALAPMTPYERRLIHTELASYKEIQTESIGEEPRRRVVVKPLILD